MHRVTSNSITFPTGDTISYRQLGKGPGLIVVHGGLETWKSHRELAEELSDSFTIYLPDRRGRGSSSPHHVEHGIIQTEINDMEALARETGARFIFGVSAGAIIFLQAALEKKGLFLKVALFEPLVWQADCHRFNTLYAQFEDAAAKGDTALMLIIGMKITEMGPPLLSMLPSWLQRMIINSFLSRKNSKEGPGRDESPSPPSLQRLAPTFRYDIGIVKESLDLPLERFAAVKDTGTETLLLSGTSSRPYLIHSCELLEREMSRVRHTRLPGLDHLGSGNKKYGGKPEIVSKILKTFFRED